MMVSLFDVVLISNGGLLVKGWKDGIWAWLRINNRRLIWDEMKKVIEDRIERRYMSGVV